MATYILKSFFAIVIILICWFQLKKEKVKLESCAPILNNGTDKPIRFMA